MRKDTACSVIWDMCCSMEMDMNSSVVWDMGYSMEIDIDSSVVWNMGCSVGRTRAAAWFGTWVAVRDAAFFVT